jgi:transcriptional regulator GlxA family with amidase domain
MHRIRYLVPEGFEVMALATQAVFDFANHTAGTEFYRIETFSVAGGEVRSSLGLSVLTHQTKRSSVADTWVICGVPNPLESHLSSADRACVRRIGRQSRRIVSICTGAFVLAEAGLLVGRRATTHWWFASHFKARFPEVQVEEDRIYIADGPIWTSAGMTAGFDLALALVERDLGADVARGTAHKLVMHQHRSGGQTQHSELLDLSPRSDRIQNALNYARRHLATPLTVDELAAAVNLSPRQFTRVFTAETGQSPARAVEGLRLEAARLMIEQSRHSLDVIAKETGFRDRRHMREVFQRGFGVPPQSLRRDAREQG